MLKRDALIGFFAVLATGTYRIRRAGWGGRCDRSRVKTRYYELNIPRDTMAGAGG